MQYDCRASHRDRERARTSPRRVRTSTYGNRPLPTTTRRLTVFDLARNNL